MNAATLFDPARLPARDSSGCLVHPDLEQPQWQADEEHFSCQAFIDAGYDLRFVDMDRDLDEDAGVCKTYFEESDPDLSAWNPSAPEGEGWLLVGIWDTEDGPTAMYLRKTVDQSNG